MELINERIIKYMPLAEKLACQKKKQIPKCVSLEELKSAAYMGLTDAANKYQEKYNTSFSTFARFRILGEIQDYLRQLSISRSKSFNIKALSQSDSLEEYDSKSEETSQEYQDFLDLISPLNDLGKQLMIWYYYEDVSLKEIGIRLKVNESRVSQLLKKFREILKEKTEYV